MNRGLDGLQPYPFEKLARLFADIDPGDKSVIPLTIGEPQHEPPSAVIQLLKDHAQDVARYPATAGSPELRAVIA
ncbi:MAG: succinyldiaminopimelate transaminase, partial [Halieaceae bacterium]